MLMDAHIIQLMMDNASANDTLALALERLLDVRYNIKFDPAHHRGRCLAHVVNLIVQKLLKSLGEIDDDPEDLDYFLLNRTADIHYSVDDDRDVMDMESQEAVRMDTSAAEAARKLAEAGSKEEEDDDDDEDGDSSENTPLKKVSTFLCSCSLLTVFIAPLAMHQNRCITSAPLSFPEVCTRGVPA
jgi:hypothetical protein